MSTEQQMMMTKGCEVEVSSQEEGLKGAYFRAVLEENPAKSGRKKLCIRYMTLLSDDGSSPLIETVQQSLVRPVPPEEEYTVVVLEEGTVVDADHREGWWTGVVINKTLEDDNYLVYFDSPPDIIKFEKTKLRAHVDWTGSKWVRPENKELDKSMFCPGTMVEVSSFIDKAEVAWFPAMLIKDGEKKFIVKDCNQHLSRYGEEARPNTTVDLRRVRPTPPPSSVEGYNLLDCVEAFHGSVWRQGLVRGVLSGKCYMVGLEATKEEHVFIHSHVRPLKVWEDGDWHNGPKRKPAVEEPPSSVMKTNPVRSSSGAKPMTPKRARNSKRDRKHVRRSMNPEENGETFTKAETVAPTGELREKEADAVINDETPPVITPHGTSIVSASSDVIPSTPVITATPLKQTVTETEEEQSSEKTPEPRSKQNGLENESTRQKVLEEENSDGKSRKRKREEKQHSDLDETDGTCNGSKTDINGTSKEIINDSDVDDQLISSWIGNLSTEVSSDQSPNVMLNSAGVTYVEETPTLIALPFVKRSPYWKRCEATEGYKSVPQRPHFIPLLEAKDDIREWSAVGMMVTFYRLVDEVKDLKPDDSSSVFCSLHDSFAELEKHGFDIAAPQSRIIKMMSLKDERAKKAEEKQCFGNKIDENEKESRKLEEDMAELKRSILELQRREAVAKEKKEAVDKRIVEMKSNEERIGQEIEDVELEILKTASAPW